MSVSVDCSYRLVGILWRLVLCRSMYYVYLFSVCGLAWLVISLGDLMEDVYNFNDVEYTNLFLAGGGTIIKEL